MSNKGRKLPAEPLTPEEVKALINACSKRALTGIRNRALLVVLYRAGLRISEALALFPKDLDAQASTLRVLHGKGDKARLVGLDAGAWAILQLWLDRRAAAGITARAPVFCTLQAQRMSSAYVRTLLPRLARRAGIIEDVCRQHGHTWRERILTPVVTVQLFLLQILWGNTACDHLPRIAGRRFTGEAYCKARSKLPLAALQEILTRITSAMLEASDATALWHGHRLWLMDGTSFSMPDAPELQRRYGQPGGQKAGCGFPVAHCVALVHAGTGLVQRFITAPLRTHDLALAWQLDQGLPANDVLVADRAYGSYAHLSLLFQRGVLGVMRAHQQLLVDFKTRRPHVPPGQKRTRAECGLPYSRWVRRLGKQDQIVEWFRPQRCPEWMSAEQFATLPKSLFVRELRYRVSQRGYRTREVTLVTTLLDSVRYSQTELVDLYRQRWRIETDFAHLKTTLGMDVLKCRTVAGVEKEAVMFVLVYNLVRIVMLEAARLQQVAVERISFIDALRWLLSAPPDSRLPELIVNPSRPHRCEPRVRKRRPKSYPLMTRPRSELRKALKNKALGA